MKDEPKSVNRMYAKNEVMLFLEFYSRRNAYRMPEAIARFI